MFWRFGFHTQSSVDALLEKEEFTLEELMDEEEILQECKAQNKKLIDFLCKAGVLEALLAYIIEDPPADVSEESKYKYPMLACEILCSDVLAIYDSLIMNEDLLEAFWKYLERPAPLNPLQSSYFTRVFGMLLQRKIPQTLAFLHKQDRCVESMMNHIGTSAMMDMIIKITSCEEVKEGEGTIKWLSDAGLIPQLAMQLDSNMPSEVHSNAAQLLIEIMNTSHSFGASKNIFLDRIKSKEICELIANSMLKTDGLNFGSAVYNGLSVYIELVQRSVQEPGDGQSYELDLTDMLSVITPRLGSLHAILDMEYKPPSDLTAASFIATKPLGSLRLKIVEFFAALLHTNNKDVCKEYVKLKVLPSYLVLFFQYPLHNFLHTLVHDMIVKILNSESELTGELVYSLLREGKLLERMVEASKLNDAESEQARGTRRAYMGHVTLIANELVKFASNNTLPEDLKILFATESWREYEKSAFAETRDRDARPLGGHRPVHTAESEEDDVFDNNMNDSNAPGTDQFARFLCHQVTADIPDKFVPDEDDDFDEMEADFDRDAEFDSSNSATHNPFDDKRNDSDDEDEKRNDGWKAQFPSPNSQGNFANFNEFGSKQSD